MKEEGNVITPNLYELEKAILRVEERVWQDYFPEEKVKFAEAFKHLNTFMRKALSIVATKQTQYKSANIYIVNWPAYYKAFDTSSIDVLRNKKSIVSHIDSFLRFYPKFVNQFLVEFCNDEIMFANKIFFLEHFKSWLEREIMFQNINLFPLFKTGLTYIDHKLESLYELRNIYNQILRKLDEEVIEQGDLYYWPLNKNLAKPFFDKLTEYNLIKPKENYLMALDEKFNPFNQVEWVKQNKQLVYLLFLLYNKERSYKGVGIHEIACHIFKRQIPLNPPNLNTQLIRLIYPNTREIKAHAIDDSLRVIDKLIADFQTPVATVQL